MECMKCGRKAESGQVFCKECLASMAEHPVKPGTAIHLPQRRKEVPSRRSSHRKKPLSLEQQIEKLRKANRRLATCLLLLTLALVLTIAGLVRSLYIQQNTQPTGRNYSTAVEE